MTTIGTTPLQRVLVANRAEIASRVFRTCRSLGIETVAIHSDADAELPYVREADHVVHLPGNAPTDTYLRADLVIDAARRTGADAVHPGYGFLSENAEFARAVIDAGLVWIGPRPESIEAMGSKIGAKQLMRDAGVPLLEAPEQPTEADLPLIVKASAGGGGRGMRIVRSLAELPSEIEKAAAEAVSAFGDGTVFVEPYIERGRHVEVQVVGTRDGVLVLGTRDCSVQRRHQKVVEEAPGPALPSVALEEQLLDAARRAAEAIDYWGAGTVEFLVDSERDRFYFLEMNTRLQVEHPVTEAVFGIDLVEMQLDVAEGHGFSDLVLEEMEKRSEDTSEDRMAARPVGHAIEVRLYAEDPSADYQPQSGVLTTFEIPREDGVRVDAGFETGSEVSTHYDAMLAKVVAHAPTRRAAARKLAGVLSRARIHGLVTNRDLLVAILRDQKFLAGDVSTQFIESSGVVSGLPRSDSELAPQPPRDAAVAAAIALAEQTRARRTVQRGIPVAWRNVTSQPQRTLFEQCTVEWFGGRDGYIVEGLAVVSASPDRVVLETDGVRTSYEVSVPGHDSYDVNVDSPRGHVRLTRVPRFVDPADAVASGSLLAPMPGTVVRVAVETGQTVEAGEPVLVLEAMKMQHTVSAPYAGVVAEINVKTGAQVASGEVLAVVEGVEA
ncbi:biotin carboxylase N-terminal domain-containing protein [Nocardioides endophyticus]|uniref:Biotin carboxylase N-terminal domain-containing protein n=1 Tax=Nocardioides endophyticus TaxID=1353775 RepID=A0ABP8Z811_9ACTN